MLERLHLRWQVVLCVGALQLAALAILGLVLVHNARTAVEDEMAAAEAGARAQVIAATGAALAAGPGEVAMRPSSPSSPTTTYPASVSASITPIAPRSASAIGRS